MGENIKIKILERTKGKPGLLQSSTYPDRDIVIFEAGRTLRVHSYEQEGNHIRVNLKRKNAKTGRDHHYLYQPHVQVFGNLPGNDPSSEAAKRKGALNNTSAQQEARKDHDKGEKVYVVGLGYRYLNNPIDGCQSFFWYEALRNGERMPEHAHQALNIVDIAKKLQYAKVNYLGGAPMIITSWLRPTAINRAVGGSSLSTHVAGGGVDWYVPQMSESEVYRALNAHWSHGLAVRPGAFCHTDNGRDAYDRLMNYTRRWDY